MKPKFQQNVNNLALQKIRLREVQVARCPTVEGYLELADQCTALGLRRESERFLHQAETLEEKINTPAGRQVATLIGEANQIMLVEVLQFLNRTARTGELVVEAAGQTFRIYVDKGEVIGASSLQYETGLPSFEMLLRVKQGQYRFIEQAKISVPRSLEGELNHLILDALRMADEAEYPHLRAVNQ